MTSIDRLAGIGTVGTAALGSGSDARSLAQQTLGEIGHRVLAWVDSASRGASTGGAAWQAVAGAAGDFRPDAAELGRQGDVYGLDQMTRELSSRLGGTPAQEGTLRRALDDFTRQAVVQFAGLAGAPGDRQIAGVRNALEEAGNVHASEGLDGVITRIETATTFLSAENRG